MQAHVQNHIPADQILSALEVAHELRCSKAHVYNVILGKVDGVSALPFIRLGRRKVVRRSSLEAWKQANESDVEDLRRENFVGLKRTEEPRIHRGDQ
jgi:Helix-turn-helix domain